MAYLIGSACLPSFDTEFSLLPNAFLLFTLLHTWFYVFDSVDEYLRYFLFEHFEVVLLNAVDYADFGCIGVFTVAESFFFDLFGCLCPGFLLLLFKLLVNTKQHLSCLLACALLILILQSKYSSNCVWQVRIPNLI